MTKGNAVTHLPTSQTVDRIAIAAVKALASAPLLTEREAVDILEELGAQPYEIDLIRTLYATRRANK